MTVITYLIEISIVGCGYNPSAKQVTSTPSFPSTILFLYCKSNFSSTAKQVMQRKKKRNTVKFIDIALESFILSEYSIFRSNF